MKKGLFNSLLQKQKSPVGFPEVPWQTIYSALMMLPPGKHIEIPSKRSDYVKILEQIAAAGEDERAKESAEFIEFIFKQEKLGNIKFMPEAN